MTIRNSRSWEMIAIRNLDFSSFVLVEFTRNSQFVYICYVNFYCVLAFLLYALPDSILVPEGTMTPRQADSIIKKGKAVTVHGKHFNETFTALFIRRDRWSIYTDSGGVFDRGDLEIVKENISDA